MLSTSLSLGDINFYLSPNWLSLILPCIGIEVRSQLYNASSIVEQCYVCIYIYIYIYIHIYIYIVASQIGYICIYTVHTYHYGTAIHTQGRRNRSGRPGNCRTKFSKLQPTITVDVICYLNVASYILRQLLNVV